MHDAAPTHRCGSLFSSAWSLIPNAETRTLASVVGIAHIVEGAPDAPQETQDASQRHKPKLIRQQAFLPVCSWRGREP
eukprot:scaffold242051_cov24-Tisochrysis_lutea.AAC.1